MLAAGDVIATCWEGSAMSQPIIYVDRSDVHPGVGAELAQAVSDLVAFVQGHEPRLVSYGFYIDRDDFKMTVVAVHPDSASLELHLQLGAPAFRTVGRFIDLRLIEVFGTPSETALGMLSEKARMLGRDARIVVYGLEAGFSRVPR
jgi:hypothetical protein